MAPSASADAGVPKSRAVTRNGDRYWIGREKRPGGVARVRAGGGANHLVGDSKQILSLPRSPCHVSGLRRPAPCPPNPGVLPPASASGAGRELRVAVVTSLRLHHGVLIAADRWAGRTSAEAAVTAGGAGAIDTRNVTHPSKNVLFLVLVAHGNPVGHDLHPMVRHNALRMELHALHVH